MFCGTPVVYVTKYQSFGAFPIKKRNVLMAPSFRIGIVNVTVDWQFPQVECYFHFFVHMSPQDRGLIDKCVVRCCGRLIDKRAVRYGYSTCMQQHFRLSLCETTQARQHMQAECQEQHGSIQCNIAIAAHAVLVYMYAQCTQGMC